MAGTSQQSTNNFSGTVYVLGDNNFIGGIANQRNEENEGAQASSSSMDMKLYYSTTLCKASPLPWCHWYTWDIDEVYTELALEDSKTSKFGVEGLFEQWHKRSPNWGSYRILIEGDAGYGKSTLMLKMASDWSKTKSDSNDYTSRFSLLLVVKLGRVGEDGNLLNYMENIYTKKMDKPLEDVLESEGAEKVLILLDGYDEANAKTKEEVDRIMKKETMSKCHVVLTSRSGHVPDHVKRVALPVRVTGFGRRQVAEAVGKFFIKAGHLTKDEVKSYIDEIILPRESDSENESDDSDFDSEIHDAILPSIDDFKNVQDMDPLLPVDQRLSLEQCEQFGWKLLAESPYKELAQCPLLCVMMCCLVSDCPNGKLPSTVSGLYFAMINRNLYRAAIKKAEAAGKRDVKWNWSVLDSRIREGHEGYLQDFGRLCVNGLKTGSTSFTLFEITGNEEEAETTDVKVTQLIEAGVLVQDTNERNPRYQVPHRTTAEFLAAYCLSCETNQNLCQQNLRDLFRLQSSFDGVAASLIQMGKTRCLAESFRGIKFPRDCLTDIPFMESYFFEHGAAATWMEFKDALPNKLTIRNTSGIFTVSSDEPNETLLHLCEVLCTRETNARPSDCLVSVLVEGKFNPELLQTLSKSGVGLERLYLKNFESIRVEYPSSEVARILQELLKSHSCPVQLSFDYTTYGLLPAVTEAMQEVPEGCRLKSFDFTLAGDDCDTSPLEKVLAKKWLSHLEHLGLRTRKDHTPFQPILKRLREPECSLTSLHLSKYNLPLEDLMMLASKLETLSLELMHLNFNVTEISKYAGKERCSLKSLRLIGVHLFLKGSLPSADENQELLLAWRNVALNLEVLEVDVALTIDCCCEFPIELFSWLNLSLPNLRTVTIGQIYGLSPDDVNDTYATYANQVLEALTRGSGDSIEDLSLLRGFWECANIVKLHPIREALQRCPRMKDVNLGYSRYDFKSAASIGPGPSTLLSPSDEEALKSDNNYYAFLKIVLSVPKLQTLTSGFFFDKWEETGAFHAIADKAEKWPGKTNDNDCKTSLTLHGLHNWDALKAMHVFRERGLEFRLRYVTEDVYEFWFPPRVVTQFQGV